MAQLDGMILDTSLVVIIGDRIRTTSNTLTIILGAVMVERLCKTRLNSDQEMDSYKNTQGRPLYDSEIRVLVKDKS
uniref:Uncharacterized protein n=1 Tax=Magallana gigas TaxID=29159 RepID=K1QDJ6_MAGGI